MVLSPETLDLGQYLQLSVSITDLQGRATKAKVIYIQIVDDKGFEVWRLSTIAKNVSDFVKVISTADLTKDTTYTVRISTNNKQTYQSTAVFKINKKSGIPLVLLPFLISPELLKDRSKKQTDKTKTDKISPADILNPDNIQENSRYDYLVYTTELDKRVCPICLKFAGKKFQYGDTNIIPIGPPEFGGKTHWGCRCHYMVIGIRQNEAVLKAKKLHLMAVLAQTTYIQTKNINTMENNI